MDAFEAIQKRRNVSRYLDTPVPDEILDEIIRAGFCAPSGLNLQPWYYVVIRSEDKKKELLHIMEGSNDSISIYEKEAFTNSVEEAAAVVLVFMYTNDYTDQRSALMGIAASVENMLIAARNRGIATCWFMEGSERVCGKMIRKHFAWDKGDLISVITLGYAESWPRQLPQKIDRAVFI